MCLCVVWQDKKCVGAKEEVSLSAGDAVFGACDNRAQYGGKGVSGSGKGDGKGKGKPTQHISAKFETPMVSNCEQSNPTQPHFLDTVTHSLVNNPLVVALGSMLLSSAQDS